MTTAECQPAHVCFVTCSGANGGIEKCTREAAAYLADLGVPLTIIVTVNDYYTDFMGSRSNLRVVHAMQGNDRPWSHGRVLSWAKLFGQLGVSSVVLCHPAVFQFANASFGAVLAGVPNIVSIVYSTSVFCRPREHRRYAGLLPGLGLWWHRLRTQIRCVMRASTCVLFATPEHAGAFYSAYEIPPRNAYIVPHLGADVDAFRPSGKARSDVRRELGMDDSLRLIAFIGRLSEEKGPDVLVEALGHLPKGVWQTTCALFVGEGPMAQQLRQRVLQMGLGGNVRFLGFCRDVQRYLAATDVAVVPSRRECFGLSSVEAMACGCPVVATRTGGLASILRDPSLGVLVEPDSPTALSEALIWLLDRPDLREQIGRRARAHVVRNYASSRVLEMLRELIVPAPGEPKIAQRLTHEMLARYRHVYRPRPAIR